jgi:hypothetical protein
MCQRSSRRQYAESIRRPDALDILYQVMNSFPASLCVEGTGTGMAEMGLRLKEGQNDNGSGMGQ